MALSDYDKERLIVRYEQYCYKHGINPQLYDIKAKIDSNIGYWENWGEIEDDLTKLKDNTALLSNKPQVSMVITKSSYKKLALSLDSTDSVAIIGDRNSGKTNLAFYLLNNYRGNKDIYLYGYPKTVKGFKNISIWSDLLKIVDSIIFIDEIHRYIKLLDRRANQEFLELLSFLAHQGNTLVFTTQLSQFITKGVEASIQTWLIKQIDIMSLKNGSKPKRILKEVANHKITDKGMALKPDEVVAYDATQPEGFSALYSFDFQNVGKDWKTPTKTATNIATETAKEKMFGFEVKA